MTLRCKQTNKSQILVFEFYIYNSSSLVMKLQIFLATLALAYAMPSNDAIQQFKKKIVEIAKDCEVDKANDLVNELRSLPLNEIRGHLEAVRGENKCFGAQFDLALAQQKAGEVGQKILDEYNKLEDKSLDGILNEAEKYFDFFKQKMNQ